MDGATAPALGLTKTMLYRLAGLQALAPGFGEVISLTPDPALGLLPGVDVPPLATTEEGEETGPLADFAHARGIPPDRLRATALELCVIANTLPLQAITAVGAEMPVSALETRLRDAD